MFIKLKNTKTDREFVVSQNSIDHYKEATNIKYLGQCDAQGNITLSAEQDLAWQKKSIESQADIISDNLKKKTAVTALHRGDPDREEHGVGETEITYDEDDED